MSPENSPIALEKRVDALEQTFTKEIETMKEILLEIRVFIVEGTSPLRPDGNEGMAGSSETRKV